MNKIAYFTVNLNSYSGAAQQALLLAKHLKGKYNIYIFNFDSKMVDKTFTQVEKNVYKIDMQGISLLQIFKLYKLIKVNKINIFHLHVLNYFIILLGRLLNKRIILKTTMLGADDFHSKLHSKLGKIKLEIIKNIDLNIALTTKIKHINSQYINPTKIKQIPNGVSIPNMTDFKKENIFVFIGLVCERKSTFESIEYFRKHYASQNLTKLYIIGPNSNEYNLDEFDEQYYQKCVNYVKKYNLDDQVIFTGLLQKKQISEILLKAKALLFFSKKEGMPNVVIEAMSHNCVPITSSIDGAAQEIFEDKQNGFIISNMDQGIALELIDELVNTRRPFNHAKEKFDIAKIATKYSKLYESLLRK